MSEPELEITEKHALAREHGAALCFVTSDEDNHVSADMSIISYWQTDITGIVVLRIQNGDNDLMVRLRQADLDWVVNEGPQELRPKPD